jgi:hypothetical protein
LTSTVFDALWMATRVDDMIVLVGAGTLFDRGRCAIEDGVAARLVATRLLAVLCWKPRTLPPPFTDLVDAARNLRTGKFLGPWMPFCIRA